MKIARYGWIRDNPDIRDIKFKVARPGVPLPAYVDLSPNLPPVYDQLDLGSCTGQAIAAAIEFDEKIQDGRSVTPSRLFIYFNERVIEGTEDSDSGAVIRDGIKSVNNTGVCPEWDWPYEQSKFAVRPPKYCYTNADAKAMLYQSLDNTDLGMLRGCLAQGLPFIFGFSVYDSFESDEVSRTGIVPMPDAKNESMIGGHAVLAVGYDHPVRQFIVRNSWGESWGQSGYFRMPYDYLTNLDLSADFWVIQRVATVQESNNPPLPTL